jgi:DNA replication protein
MSFELFDVNALVRIAAAGGGFRLEASLRTTNDLVRVAAAAGNSGASIAFAGMVMRPIDDLVRIAAAGKGRVTFED